MLVIFLEIFQDRKLHPTANDFSKHCLEEGFVSLFSFWVCSNTPLTLNFCGIESLLILQQLPMEIPIKLKFCKSSISFIISPDPFLLFNIYFVSSRMCSIYKKLFDNFAEHQFFTKVGNKNTTQTPKYSIISRFFMNGE